ncbi:MAG: PDZ domain-containing protein [Planctomycetales bacterium]|nr:PDZ domain-containing protein [Planctomycetales bacterium]
MTTRRKNMTAAVALIVGLAHGFVAWAAEPEAEKTLAPAQAVSTTDKWPTPIQVQQSEEPAQLTGLSRVPKFGFVSNFGETDGVVGEHVMRVNFGSPAARLGLETGDAIVAVNGRRLTSPESWYQLIDRAMEHDGWVTLKIRDARTGTMAYRTANLFRLNVR